ncbi:MAG: hypothetical protein MJK11_20640, partial [Pseudomonadales bacterium]|nr:hypothetical protein [Pseudomonadales bacterium]
VGYHMLQNKEEKRYLEAALLYDAALYNGPWPIKDFEGVIDAIMMMRSEGNGDCTKLEWRWCGYGVPLDKASVELGKGWDTWAAYKKIIF